MASPMPRVAPVTRATWPRRGEERCEVRCVKVKEAFWVSSPYYRKARIGSGGEVKVPTSRAQDAPEMGLKTKNKTKNKSKNNGGGQECPPHMELRGDYLVLGFNQAGGVSLGCDVAELHVVRE